MSPEESTKHYILMPLRGAQCAPWQSTEHLNQYILAHIFPQKKSRPAHSAPSPHLTTGRHILRRPAHPTPSPHHTTPHHRPPHPAPLPAPHPTTDQHILRRPAHPTPTSARHRPGCCLSSFFKLPPPALPLSFLILGFHFLGGGRLYPPPHTPFLSLVFSSPLFLSGQHTPIHLPRHTSPPPATPCAVPTPHPTTDRHTLRRSPHRTPPLAGTFRAVPAPYFATPTDTSAPTSHRLLGRPFDPRPRGAPFAA